VAPDGALGYTTTGGTSLGDIISFSAQVTDGGQFTYTNLGFTGWYGCIDSDIGVFRIYADIPLSPGPVANLSECVEFTINIELTSGYSAYSYLV